MVGLVVFGAYPVMLAAVPAQFNSVEFGAVGRQKQQAQSLGCPFGVAGAHDVGLVNRGVVEDQDGGAVQGLAELVHGQHEQVGRERASPPVGVQGLAGPAGLPEAQHGVPAAAARGGQFDRGLAPALPGVGHGGLAQEAARVHVDHGPLAAGIRLVQFAQVDLAGGKGGRVALGPQGAPAALLGVARRPGVAAQGAKV